MLPRIAALFLILSSVACSGSKSPAEKLGLPPEALAAAEIIQGETLHGDIAHLSSDALAGRGPGTAGDSLARQYIAETLEQLGFEPGGPDGSWEQPIGLIGITSQMPERWSFRGTEGDFDLHWWEDYVGCSGVQQDQVTIDDAEVVFVGYGITAPEEEWDDYKGADLKGKVLLMLNNDPDWDPELFAGVKRLFYGRWTYKYESAARQGAAGAIIIHTVPSAGYPWGVVQNGWSGEQFEMPAGDEPRVPLTSWVTFEAARTLVALGGRSLEQLIDEARAPGFRPVPLRLNTSIEFSNQLNRNSSSANVLGLLPGRDPELRDEVVIYTAHHDHLGIGAPDDSGDTIYNGARDNAAGVASILNVARAFAALPERPRRSILIMPVGAEEQGLLGSKTYSRNPTVHPGKIAANINVDSPNTFGRTKDVAIIGRGKSSLETLLAVAAEMQERVIVDEPFPDKGYYYRSDQFNFAKIGVPALYFKAGDQFVGQDPDWGRTHEDHWRSTRYHQPGDEIYEDWDLEGLAEDSRLAFWVGLAAAEAYELPSWNPGDEFEEIRQQALTDAASR